MREKEETVCLKKDRFGPEYVLNVYDSAIGMEGFLVLDNLVLGPGKGGVRMTSSVSVNETIRLARTMTWKNALAEIPFGGAKSGIVWRGGDQALKKAFIQSFARRIRFLTPKLYVAGPDVNTGEKEMKWFVEATGNWRSATGKPAELCVKQPKSKKVKCGIPHEFGSTGFGVVQATVVAAKIKGIEIDKLTVAIDGFGNVGSFVFKYLQEAGALVVAVSDSRGGAFSAGGFNESVLKELKKEGRSVSDYPGAKKLSQGEIFKLPVDVLVPASVTDVINQQNKEMIKAKIIVEGANIPMPEWVENDLWSKGILIVPDLIANAGGVISSYAEYRGYNPKRMFQLVERKIKRNTHLILEESLKKNRPPREVATKIAQERIKEAARVKVKKEI